MNFYFFDAKDLRRLGRFLAILISFVIGIGVSVLCVHFLKDDSYSPLFIVVIPLVYFGLKFYSKCPNCKKSFCTRKIGQETLREELAKGTKKVHVCEGEGIFVMIKDIEIYTKCDKCGFENFYTVTKKTEV